MNKVANAPVGVQTVVLLGATIGVELNDTQTNALRLVEEWDMTRVKRYMVGRMNMKPEYVDRIEVEYKRFIALNLLYPKKTIPIAGDVDKMWHAHILHTHDYTDFGIAVAGGYLHHNPTANDDESSELYTPFNGNTLTLYDRVFGTPDMKIWHDAVCYCDNNN